MSRKRRDDLSYGPGNTHWYVGEGGEIYRCRWNDAAWCNPTHVHINQLTASQVESLLDEAYRAGAADAKEIIKRSLGI